MHGLKTFITCLGILALSKQKDKNVKSYGLTPPSIEGFVAGAENMRDTIPALWLNGRGDSSSGHSQY
jgi:hypothetical protein